MLLDTLKHPKTSKNIQKYPKIIQKLSKIIQPHPKLSKNHPKSSKLCIFLWSTSWNDVKPRACSPKPGGNGSPWHLSAGKLMISVPYQRYLAEGYIRFIYLVLRGYNWDKLAPNMSIQKGIWLLKYPKSLLKKKKWTGNGTIYRTQWDNNPARLCILFHQPKTGWLGQLQM